MRVFPFRIEHPPAAPIDQVAHMGWRPRDYACCCWKPLRSCIPMFPV